MGRGGYLTDDGIWTNSDCNGAANIVRKQVMTQLKNVSLAKVTRGVLSRPHRYNIFNDLSRLYRIRSEEACLHSNSHFETLTEENRGKKIRIRSLFAIGFHEQSVRVN